MWIGHSKVKLGDVVQVLSPHREELERLQQAAEASGASAEDKVAPIMHLQVDWLGHHSRCLKHSCFPAAAQFLTSYPRSLTSYS